MRKHTILRKVLIFTCCIIFCYSGWQLFSYYYETRTSKKEFQTLETVAFEEVKDETETIKETGKKEQQEAKKEKKFQYEKLKEQNEDTFGWIMIEGTRIDYPVMYRDGDNEFYLHHNFQKEYSITGTPFLDGNWNPKAKTDNFIIYAHHMKDGSMFADLMKYEDSEFYEQHKQVTLYVKNEKHTYQIFAVCRVSANYEQEFYNMMQLEQEEYESYLEAIKEKALYATDSYPKNQEKLLLLSTCEYSQENGRLIVLAKELI